VCIYIYIHTYIRIYIHVYIHRIDKAKWICVASIDLTQIAVAAYLASVGETTYAAVLAALIAPQMYLQV
jgi:hypothetical protein